jgi:hypothetical protein
MTPRNPHENRLLRQILDGMQGTMPPLLAESVLKTSETMFNQKMYAAQRPPDREPLAGWAAAVVFLNPSGRFLLRLTLDLPLLEKLVAGTYPKEAAFEDGVLEDAAGEMANIVGGMVKTAANKRGFDLARDLPVVAALPAGAPQQAGPLSLDFSIYQNTLAARNLLNVSLL